MSVCQSVGWSVGPLVRLFVRPSAGPSISNAFVLAGRDEPSNDLFRVYELFIVIVGINTNSGDEVILL